MKCLVEHVHLLFLPLRCKLGLRGPPLGVEQLCKVNESEAGASASPASKVEDDGRFQGGEKRITRTCSSVIHKVGLVDTTIGGLGSRLTDDPVPELGIATVMEGAGSSTSRPYPSL